jgi:hypothetical protein
MFYVYRVDTAEAGVIRRSIAAEVSGAIAQVASVAERLGASLTWGASAWDDTHGGAIVRLTADTDPVGGVGDITTERLGAWSVVGYPGNLRDAVALVRDGHLTLV